MRSLALRQSARRYLVPLLVGALPFVLGHVTDHLIARFHLPIAVVVVEDSVFALLTAGIVYVFYQRFEIVSERLRTFTSEVGHQLRTPLSIMRTVGELGLQRPLSAAQYQDILASMLEEVDGVSRLTDDLLLIARMDSGQIHLARTRLRVSELVQEVAGVLEVLAQEKSQALSIDAVDDALVKADRTMLRQAFMNLLDNAIKYTPEGGVVAVRSRRPLHGQVEIVVSDNGPGLHPEDAEQVFQRFFRSAPDHSGTGLGLSISKSIVEAHGGKIVCDSMLGQGCSFTVQHPTCD
jgi:signal transduction histidine kinase